MGERFSRLSESGRYGRELRQKTGKAVNRKCVLNIPQFEFRIFRHDFPLAISEGDRIFRFFVYRAVAQLGSALEWGSRGRGFESRRPDILKPRGVA